MTDDNICIVPDTSVIIDGRVTSRVKSGEFKGARILIPEAVVSELEAQANRGRETGFNGLEELKELSDMAKEGLITLEFVGKRPSLEQIKLASGGEIDAMIRSVAMEHGATFLTSDRVQAEVAKAKGLNVEYLLPKMEELKPLMLEDFFTDDTLSVHLKEKVPPMAKRGTVGKQRFEKIRDQPCTGDELRAIARELVSRAKLDPDSFLEIEYPGATVLQIGTMRVAIASPPFSDGIEITAVHPVAIVRLDDYRLSAELKKRFIEQQRGILIAGPPGAGKSTFAAGVAEFLTEHQFVVKTMESPRDLQVSDAITQYSPIEQDMEKTADVLLLVRPDYTIYDEVRKTKDFKVFADMRMAGVGMIGVVHANRAVDAIQRLIGRVELGIIPQIVDTVIFIEKGEVAKVYDIRFTVKVPSGMIEEDLARPVILVEDFETKTPEYEIYTYGEQVVVMPVVEKIEKHTSWKLAAGEIKREVERYTRNEVDVEVISDNRAAVYAEDEDIPAILGKGGRNIDAIEKKLGIHIDVRKTDPEKLVKKRKEAMASIEVTPLIKRTKKNLVIDAGELAGETVNVYSGNEYLFTATVTRKGTIKISKETEIAYRIIERPEEVKVRLAQT